MEPRSCRVPGSDGIELQVLSWSDTGVPLVMLHGFGNDAHVWDDFAPAVAPYYRTMAFDLRGHVTRVAIQPCATTTNRWQWM